MRTVSLVLFCFIYSQILFSQSFIGTNTTFLGAYGLQQELSVGSQFYKKLHLDIRVGSNFKSYSTYKFGLRYDLITLTKAKFQVGVDLGHLKYKQFGLQTYEQFRTFELLAGASYNFYRRIEGVTEIGVMNGQFSTESTSLLMRLGLRYKL